MAPGFALPVPEIVAALLKEHGGRAMNITLAVREAARDDREGIALLLRRSGLSAQGVLLPGTRYWVVETPEDGVIGVAGLEMGEDAALLRSVAVHPAHRGRGIGTLLVRRALIGLLAWRCAHVYLFGGGADGYWERHGFRQVPSNDLLAALPNAPQVRLYQEHGWAANERAWRKDFMLG